MPEMVLDCPHCKSERVGFDFGGEIMSRSDHAVHLMHQGIHATWNTLFQCRHCRGGVAVKLGRVGQKEIRPSDCHGDPCDPRDSLFRLIATYPEPQAINAPEYVPEAISGNYQEAVDNLQRQNWTSAVMMFRKVLDRATKELAGSLSNEDRIPDAKFEAMNLYKRIAALAEIHEITPAMKDWADAIRLDGNDATHEEDADEGIAPQIHAFTELSLTYAFTLPAHVNERAAQRAMLDRLTPPSRAVLPLPKRMHMRMNPDSARAQR